MSTGTEPAERAARDRPPMILAVDTGGTFTDFLLLEHGVLRVLKVPSTPDDPAEAVLAGARELLGDARGYLLAHGSTVATNALLERKGARVFLVTNRGFEDVIEIGRQNRPQLYALVGHRPPPLVAREDRVGIAGRLGPHGEVDEPLDAAELEALPGRLAGAGAVAIALLHSYADPAHERAVRAALGDETVPLSVSSAILPEYREYERVSTTVVNAYVSPVVSRYLGRIERESGAGRIRVMGSNGGALSVARAMAEPVHTVLSGPAGGVVGALDCARRSGHGRILTFDMGGTSTDVSLCPDRPLRTREFEIDGQPVAIPVIDIHTVGAGGGSLARVDPGGALRVGPRSAGAVPGPIAYGRGGVEPTVTDAHVWLGRLPSEGFLGGGAALDRDAVEGPLRKLADALGSSLEEAAEGIVRVANSAMERALRVISVERGYDPADFVLVSFGGAGGLHAAQLTASLGAARALVPPDPGLLSAYGMLVAPPTLELSRTVLLRAGGEKGDEGTQAQIDAHFRELEEEALARMREDTGGEARDHPVDDVPEAGAAARTLTAERWVDARYRGQSFELRVPADGWIDRFHASHRERYGYDRVNTPVEAVTLRVLARAPGRVVERPLLEEARTPPPLEDARVFTDGAWTTGTRVWRHALRPGHRLEGPCLVLEYSSTTWLPPGWRLRVDPAGNLLLDPAV
ncbi:MAG: hydantoinase/oxoprolinase family protein [Gemmatimonadota bacterium]